MTAPKFVSPKIIIELKKIFIEQKWEIENDFLFNRFCETLSFLDENEQRLFCQSTRVFGVT
jgi:hypothetical protein